MGAHSAALSSSFPSASEGPHSPGSRELICVINAALWEVPHRLRARDDGCIVILSSLVIPSEVEESLTIMLDKGRDVSTALDMTGV